MAERYTTIQGDTWDQIALKVYESDVATRDIMAENGTRDPRLLAAWRFDYGEVLDAPERTADTETVAQLPPWRREYDAG